MSYDEKKKYWSIKSISRTVHISLKYIDLMKISNNQYICVVSVSALLVNLEYLEILTLNTCILVVRDLHNGKSLLL